MFRFFVDQKEKNYFLLNKETLNHIKVSRIQSQKFICVYKEEFYITILEANKAKILEKLNENHEFKNDVIIAASIINTKRFEWLIQKATELGATKLFPMYSENVVQKLGNNIEKKVERWNKIAKSASEQSFRNKAMIVEMPCFFDEIIKEKILNKYIAHEKCNNNNNLNELYEQNSIFLIGPEGGFSEKEVELAQKNGFQTIFLGKRILRAETATLFILSRIKQ
ncbi:16S rRNA (uracil(1498)-N(3))-methyltransferase [Mesomycoplasma neurolyticum]|uniref:Ribosomal RNA small subunit methyltransferase E n=1 Tax=Mesomycoplasma neurolyticum TaxID=2120 RepID=A0A449A587_9BACT|nr:16S rRNA (uracil(1498)-N(3))-methyltransferase [Mesomycoplasma neurolyticum]VEU59431.1 RsmE family RNA methyltransferase [Mesomycoplasma neurolyticum]